MKAQDLANYFTKKIAKPIAYTYLMPDRLGARGRYTERLYTIETTAVDDHVFHALVTLKSETSAGGLVKLSRQPVFCDEVQIPIEDEDTVLDVLGMAVAEADFGQECVDFPENNLMRLHYEDLHGRQAYSEMRRIGII